MIFFKTLKYDIKNGITKEYKKYIFAVIFFLSAAVIFRLSRIGEVDITLGDYILFTHLGMPEYIRHYANRFQFPIIWICFHMLAFFIVLYYPYNDIDSFGRYILINTRSRRVWYLSKCCWVIISILLYFALHLLSQLLICHIFMDSVSFDLSGEEAFRSIYQNTSENLNVITHIPVQLYIMPAAVCMTIGLFQMTLSLFIKPFYSYVVSAAILILSAYYVSPLMIGNYAMVQRSELFLKNGVSAVYGICICITLSLISVISGIINFSRYDILNRG